MSKAYHFRDTQTGVIVGSFIGSDAALVVNTPAGCDVIEGDAPATVAPVIDAAWSARAHRDALLTASDWTQLADVTLTNPQRAAWAKYRKDLRDLTTAPGFPNALSWPVLPAKTLER